MQFLRIANIFGLALLICISFLLNGFNLLTKVSDYLLMQRRFDSFQIDSRESPKSLKFYVQQNSVYLRRVQRIQKSCINNTEMFLGKSTDKDVKSNLFVDSSLQIAICTIQKVGSKFIKELLKKLSSESKSRQDQGFHYLNEGSDIFRFYDADKIMFVREPYTRALSGYVDKLFTPNTEYWKHFGTGVISGVRKNATKHSLNCGHDVTFPEFIKFIILNELKANKGDPHFTPLHEHCRPCQISYDFIGKMESFKEDILFLFNVWNSKVGVNISFGDFETETAESRENFQSNRLFHMRHELGYCSSFYNAAVRTWRSLQIRGLIPVSVVFPFDQNFTEYKMNVNDFFLAAKKAMSEAKDKVAMKAQRDEALIEAFSMIQNFNLDQLKTIFLPDCEMFGYDSKPSVIFNTSRLYEQRTRKYFIL